MDVPHMITILQDYLNIEYGSHECHNSLEILRNN